jgi:iron-sulfur cluster assembly enzyme ISCU, mitochondrial
MLSRLASKRALNRSWTQVCRAYHENIVEHYENPRNVGSFEKTDDSVGTVRSFPFLLFVFAGVSSYFSHCRFVVLIVVITVGTVHLIDGERKGLVGAPACGDVMRLQIKVDELTGRIIESKFKTFGCGSAIASSSVVTEWVKGKTVDDVLSIKNSDIAAHLKLPPVKLHCSMLAEDAIKAAVSDWKLKQQKKKTASLAAEKKIVVDDAEYLLASTG